MIDTGIDTVADRFWLPWYDTQAWQRKRKAQLARQPLCEDCLKVGRYTSATVAHHIVKHNGDPDLFWNGELASVCAPCHNRYEQQVENAGYSSQLDDLGYPVDPNHPFNK